MVLGVTLVRKDEELEQVTNRAWKQQIQRCPEVECTGLVTD